MAKNWKLEMLGKVQQTCSYNLQDADQWLFDHDNGESNNKAEGKEVAISLINQCIGNLEDLKKEVSDG